ncbi:type IV pilus biogenesis protein PilM [Saccharophagus degradans]|uniref:Pilus assembly protein PilM n=1 Tax=Saccharophagus degradans TaxID=86304 RepID=A0AAW7X5H7_9GAMM|nr:pilus assembly protein PilM [Saccharophagus degradans]MDO6422837.1 pilus assembly protein PilM [Saccharophagus degradans]MDO6609258.1 pilus assembly protein PilM [Saccharophagus degradans]
MQFFKSRLAGKAVVGIELSRAGIAVVVLGREAGGKVIQTSTLIAAQGQNSSIASFQSDLSELVEKHQLKAAKCNLVLAKEDYQLLLVEAPDVPDAEIKEAIRWRVKDLISTPVEQAALDVFLLPDDGARGGKKMVYVVVADKARIKEIVDFVAHSQLSLNSIDIVELAMRNITLALPDEAAQVRGIALVRIGEGVGSVSVYRQGNLYLSRQFQIQYSGGLLDDLPVDSLALEVQRSLDYYERQMGQAQPAALYVCGENISEDKVNDELKRALPLTVNWLDASALVPSAEEEPDEGIAQLCVGALGACMREASA